MGKPTPKTIGWCIYCGAKEYSPDLPGRELAEEHIVPVALNGNLILRQASCRACEREINRFETAVINKHFPSARAALRMRGRRRKRQEARFEIELRFKDPAKAPIKVRVPASEYPHSVCFMLFDYPAILGASRPDGGRKLLVKYFDGIEGRNRKLDAVAIRHGAASAHIETSVASDQIRKWVAKIGHGMMYYLLEPNEFEPILNDLILGRAEADAELYVGCDGRERPKKADYPGLQHLVETGAIPAMRNGVEQPLLLMRFRPFGDGPEYLVATGWLTEHFRGPREAP